MSLLLAETLRTALERADLAEVYITSASGAREAIAQREVYARVLRALGKTNEWGIDIRWPAKGLPKGCPRLWKILAVRYDGMENTIDPSVRYVTGTGE